MTMADNKCDICGLRPPIGVASTMIPYSCAICMECCRIAAQPELVFLTWAEDFPPDGCAFPDDVYTFKDNEYVTYRQWYEAHHKRTEI